MNQILSFMKKNRGHERCPLTALKSQQDHILVKRRKTRQVKIGQVPIGGGAPIAVQSMTKTDTRDIKATLAQVKSLEQVDCEIVRLAVPDTEAVEALGEIKRRTKVPLVADIHFDYRLAIASLEKGVDGLRINPGNIGSKEKVKEVVKAAKEKKIPVRIGVNSGSLERYVLEKYGGATAEAMVESALRHIRILEDLDFSAIKISLKAPHVYRTVKAYQLLASKVDYPFHAGITEAGGFLSGTVKSSAGLGFLITHGLADTVRVSLTAPPEEEVRIAFLILSSLGLRSRGPDIISCPVCGRCEMDFFRIASEIEKSVADIKENIRVAVMGCMVNGPGEAKEADIGLVCGRGVGIVYRDGHLYRKLQEKEIIPEFIKEVRKAAQESHKVPVS
ncbi:MAG: flavodoxin-dependent (E)-4-hydroxy-3-methylbut-2-enyl-diphosphate synthase [Candidatus Aminicenantes bacterium]